MKKIFTIWAALFLIGISTFGQIPTNGLVGWWSFNGNANDLSGYGYNGTINGAILTTDRFGNSNSAYYCPVHCYIQVLNYPVSTPEISVSGWFKCTQGARIFQHDFNSPNGSFLVHLPGMTSTQGMFCLPGNTSHITMTSQTSTGNNQWHHVVITKSTSSTPANLYIDGILCASYTTVFTLNNGVASLYFGNAETTSNLFNGSVDDIRIYNRELSQTEVTELFNESSSYSVSLSSNPSNGGSTSGGGTFQTGSQVTVSASSYSGFNFSSWTENSVVVSTSPSYSFYISGNRNLVANFIPSQSITVTSPNGGEIWQVGCSYNITWTSTGVSNVKIEYSSNNGSSWNTIVSSYQASNNFYSWTIPNTPSGSCLVKISDVSNLSIFDISNSTFTITIGGVPINGLKAWYPFNGNANDMSGNGNNGTVTGATLTNDRFGMPNSAYYFNGSSYIVVPPSNSLDLRNNVSVSVWIRADAINFSGGSHQIVFKGDNQNAHDPYYITITNGNVVRFGRYTGSGYISVTADFPTSLINTVNFFHLVGTYDSISGAQKIYLNGVLQTQTSSFTYINYTTSSMQNSIGADQSTNDQFYSGVIDDILIYNRALTQDEIIQLYNESPLGTVAVTSPNGYESWQAGTTHNITWISSNISNVKIEYTYDNGSNWNVIVNGYPASSGTYSWIVPNTPSTQCKVRISDASNSCTNDLSDNNFTITSGSSSSIMVLSPNGGEIWQVGYNYNISWTSSGVSQVNIEYSTNNGSTWSTIVNSYQSGGTSSYQWTVPNTPSNQCRVKITDANNSSTWDESDNVFTILGSGSSAITVLSPNGNEIWQVGLSYYIIWNSTNVTNVRIDYSIDNGFSWIPIAYSTPSNTGYYPWIVPNTPSTNCLMKISDVSNPGFFDISDSPFTITPVTGIEEQKEQVKTFPNPTTGQLKIQSDKIIRNIVIYNSMGQQVGSLKEENSELTIDMSNLGKGIYYIRMLIGDKPEIQKIVVL